MAEERSSKFITYQDIADALGITKMTVSKAMRNSPDISDKTKQMVRQKADELGYIPNTLASNLRSIKSNIVSIVFNSFRNPYFSIVCNKLFETLEERGYICQLYFCEENKLDDGDVKKLMVNKCCAVLSLVEPTEGAAHFFCERKIPFLLLGINSHEPGVDCVYTDDYAGGRLVGEYCVANGYHCALYCSDSLSETSFRRYKGFADAVTGTDCELENIPCGDPNEMVHLVSDRMTERNYDFIFCFSDSFAIQLLAEYEEAHGYCFAKVFGFDNLHKYYPIIRKMNSVDSDMDAIIRYSCDRLIDKIEGRMQFEDKIDKAFGVVLAVN